VLTKNLTGTSLSRNSPSTRLSTILGKDKTSLVGDRVILLTGTIRWSYFTPVNFRSLTSLPAQVATALRTNTKLARIGLHIRAENGQLPRRKLSSVFIPAGNLKALNLSIPILEGDRVEFWASAGKLRHLRLAGGTRINFSAGPTSLSYLSFGAGSYQFNLTTPWHLPKLTTLVLESIDLVRYFRTVPASTFPNLRTLRVFCSILGSAPPPPLYQDLVAFIEKFSTLVEIDFGGTHDVTMTSKAIARHGATLRRLDLGRVLPQSRDLKQNLKASIVSHLELIAHSCSNLKTLVLEASVLVVIGDRQSYTPLEVRLCAASFYPVRMNYLTFIVGDISPIGNSGSFQNYSQRRNQNSI